jgi:chromosome segregation ATPase
MLRQLLSSFGLVRRAQYQAAVDRARKLEERMAALTEARDACRKDVASWKKRAEETARSLSRAKEDAAHHAARAQKLQARLEKEVTRLEEHVARDRRRHEMKDQVYSTELETLKHRLDSTQRDLTATRESLMTVDVKLDILEGAANVLDVRTRAIIEQREPSTQRAV